VLRYAFPTLILALMLPSACSRKDTEANGAKPVTSAPSRNAATLTALPSSDRPIARLLPDQAGTFVAGPLETQPQFVRRDYSHGSTRISVTLADVGASAVTFKDWVKMSGGAPAVKLDAPADSAAGFYECDGDSAGAECNVHIHFRVGYHLEMMGEGNAHRTDFDALLSGLPIRTLAKGPS
jgi:hypothetical protein